MSSSGPPAPPEVPVWLQLNGKHIWTWLCTPTSLESLACGWLIGEGHISGPDQIVQLDIFESEGRISAQTSEPAAAAAPPSRVLSAGPGQAGFSVERIAISAARSVPDLVALYESGRLGALFRQMFEACPLRAQGGGIHSGALLTDGEIVHVHEDVGRHNVMDKVIGAAALASTSLERSIVLLSGRISGEIAVKGWRAGIGGIATLSIPSSLARAIAERAGIWMIGRSQRGSPIIYRPGERADQSPGAG